MTYVSDNSFRKDAEQIQLLIDDSADSDEFINALHASNYTHISFSQVIAFETCPRQYYLRYILGRELSPVPEYFIKGKALHQTIANAYRATSAGLDFGEDIIHYDGVNCFSQSGNHLRNAYLTMRQNMFTPDEIVGIEKPFVFLMADSLPPVVGVIDLILRRGNTLILVDHKTGRDFYQPDILQMAVYISYLRATGLEGNFEFYYDHYRWVENLSRIRKPAFERRRMEINETELARQKERLAAGFRGIGKLKKSTLPERTGQCYRCACRNIC